MRFTLSVLTVCFMTACGGSSIAPTSGSSFATPTSTPSTGTSGDVSFQGILNVVRADAGSNPVTYNAQLDQAAQDHAQDMLDNDYFDHVSLDGRTIGDRATDAGYDWRTVGENIAAGFNSESSVLNAWVNSPGHQANNINPSFEEFGLGYAANGGANRWVLVFGAQR